VISVYRGRRSFLSLILAAGVVSLLALSGLGLESPLSSERDAESSTAAVEPTFQLPPGGDYPTYLGSIERTSSSSSELMVNLTSAPQIRLLWNFSTSTYPNRGAVKSQPIEQNGVVYFGAQNGYEYAVNAITGKIVWHVYLGVDQNDSGCGDNLLGVTSTGTVSGSTLYVDGGYPYLYALNLSSGATEWRAAIGGSNDLGFYDWSSPLIYKGDAYVGIASDCDHPLVPAGLAEYSLATGGLMNYFNSSVPEENGSSIWGSPSVNPTTNTVFLTTGNAYNTTLSSNYSESIVALNATTLAVEDFWQVPPATAPGDSDFGVTPTIFTPTGGVPMVTAANKNGNLYAFYQSNLTLAWQARVCCGTYQDDHFSTSWGGGSVYAVGAETSIGGVQFNSSVHAYNPVNGSEEWKVGFPESSYSGYAAPLYVNGLLVVADGPDLLFLNAHSGKLLLTEHVGGVAVAAASIARGEIYVGSSDGSVLAFDVTLSASAGESTASGTSPLVVSFSGGATGGLPPYTYSWSFGDGGNSTSQSPPYEYSHPGTYIVVLNVTDQAGNFSTQTLSVLVSTAPPGKGPSTVLEVAGLVAGIVVVIALYLVIVAYRRRAQGRKPADAGAGESSPPASGTPRDSSSSEEPRPPSSR
jgi:outer membrane protein assembly factor BamB